MVVYNGGMVRFFRTWQDTSANLTLANSVVAMKRNVIDSVLGAARSFGSSTVSIAVVTSFGMTYSTNIYGTSVAAALSGYTTDAGFTDLPYVPLDYTDPDGTEYSWDFVFANLSGTSSYSDYTHLSVHTDVVSAAFHTTFSSVTTPTLTYSNLADRKAFTDASLDVTYSDLDVVYDYSKEVVVFK